MNGNLHAHWPGDGWFVDAGSDDPTLDMSGTADLNSGTPEITWDSGWGWD